MTTYRLMDGVGTRPGVGSSQTTPPASPTSFGAAFQAGLIFACSQVMWFQGFWWYVPAGGDTAPQKFALWSVSLTPTPPASAGSLIASVTSGTLTAGQFNFIPLATPVPLSQSKGGGGLFVATTAWTAVHGFPDTLNQFGNSNPYASGITNGPLSTFGITAVPGGGSFWSANAAGSTFGTAGADPTTTPPPLSTDGSYDLFWLDVQVSDTAPVGYTGPYSLWPNRGGTNTSSVLDTAANYVIATEFHLSQPCTVGQIGYFSPAGTAQLATRASIWSVTGGGTTGTEVVAVASPSWSGAAASGWVYCNTGSSTVLPAGKYKVSVYNSAATPDQWSIKDATTNYWATGEGASGISNGPLSAPQLSAASTAFEYNGNPAGTPPNSNGLTEAGQCTFAVGPPNQYPYLYVDALAQFYAVDVSVTPAASGSGLLMASFP